MILQLESEDLLRLIKEGHDCEIKGERYVVI